MRYMEISDGMRRIEVSELCVGTMSFGTTVDEATSWAILDRFVEAGGTFIDTANAYTFWAGGGHGGESEEVIGRWLRSRNAYDRVVVASKVGAHIADTGHTYDAHDREGLSPEVICEAVAASRRRLGVDRIDLYYVHADDRATPLEQTVAAMGRLLDRGDVAMVGASNHTTWRLAQARDIARAMDVAAADVFAIIADPATMPLWYDAVTQGTKTTPGPPTVGATYQISRSLPRGRRRPPHHAAAAVRERPDVRHRYRRRRLGV